MASTPRLDQNLTIMSVDAASLAELLELVSRSLHSGGHSAGLFPSQWAALRYFARAPQANRTATHLARFQGMSSGPVSRTVRTLQAKGLVAKSPQQPKGRSEWLELTAAGLAMMERDPLRDLVTALARLEDADRLATAKVLDTAIRSLSATNATLTARD